MNKYKYTFTSVCPNDDEKIEYELNIESLSVIFAEAIVSACKAHAKAFHEAIADDLERVLGGKQTITATHCGVLIRTERGAADVPGIMNANPAIK